MQVLQMAYRKVNGHPLMLIGSMGVDLLFLMLYVAFVYDPLLIRYEATLIRLGEQMQVMSVGVLGALGVPVIRETLISLIFIIAGMLVASYISYTVWSWITWMLSWKIAGKQANNMIIPMLLLNIRWFIIIFCIALIDFIVLLIMTWSGMRGIWMLGEIRIWLFILVILFSSVSYTIYINNKKVSRSFRATWTWILTVSGSLALIKLVALIVVVDILLRVAINLSGDMAHISTLILIPVMLFAITFMRQFIIQSIEVDTVVKNIR